MPIYEYVCMNCGRETEVIQKFSDPPLCKCEHCQGSLKKLISQNSFQLKGSGWYVTDYSSKSSSMSSNSNDGASKKDSSIEKKESKISEN